MNRIYRGINIGIQVSFVHFTYFHYKRDKICQPSTTMINRKSAFHEAGHATYAHKLGLRIIKVHLCNKPTKNNDTLKGETSIEAYTSDYFDVNPKNTIKIYAAGLIVEYILFQRSIPSNWPLEWYNSNLVGTTDWLLGKSLSGSDKIPESDLDCLKKYIDDDHSNRFPLLDDPEVKMLPDELRQSWDKIERVATALINMQSLTGNNLLIALSDNYYEYLVNIFKELLRSHSAIIID